MPQYPRGRQNRLIKDRHHDAYYEREKLPEPTLCSGCGAVFIGGRWTWEKPPREAKVQQALCPACRRIKDNYPAGTIELRGEFLREHREEIEHLIRNVEEQEKARHPLQRLIAIAEAEGGFTVTTAGIHLARRIGEALAHSYKGDISFQYADEEQSVRVYWQR